MRSVASDPGLIRSFDTEVTALVPHLEQGGVVNPTPLVDVTDVLVECAESEYGLKPRVNGLRVFAKMDSKLAGGSVKVRPAVSILREAIIAGRLRRGQTIFEATSGNFGLALTGMVKLGFDVVALVSRKLQQGVVDGLRAGGIKLVNLDIDVCPAPGLKGDADTMLAKGIASSVRKQLSDLGFDPKSFDGVRDEAEALLARQDAIGLAKVLARAYGGFCTEQYDNGLNAEVHRTVTGPEIDTQLRKLGTSLAEADFVCAFGTGGTASGISQYIASSHGRKGVRVVFPLSGQDVAGIRTKEKAGGLRFYDPASYVGEHEADFDEASKVFEYFNKRGFDVGESGALTLYASIQLINYGVGNTFVVMVADGASKYVSEVQAVAKKGKRDQVRLEEAAASIDGYGSVVWVHNTFAPKSEGISAIASSLGVEAKKIRVASAGDVQAVLNGAEPSRAFEEMLPKDGKAVLLVCMAGNTSLMMARVLERRGVSAESLVGGITGLPASRGRQPFELVELAKR
jgi:cysteine synthase